MSEDMGKLIRPSDESIKEVAKDVVSYTECCGGASLFTDGEGNLRAEQAGHWVEGWESLGQVEAATERLAVRRIQEALDTRL